MRSKSVVRSSSSSPSSFRPSVVSSEPLESRKLFAATAVFSNGVLNLNGTAGKEDVYVTVAPGNKINILQVVTSGYQQTHSFANGSVKSIKATLGDGNDVVLINEGIGAIPATLDGGKGDDILTGGAAGKDQRGGGHRQG